MRNNESAFRFGMTRATATTIATATGFTDN